MHPILSNLYLWSDIMDLLWSLLTRLAAVIPGAPGFHLSV